MSGYFNKSSCFQDSMVQVKEKKSQLCHYLTVQYKVECLIWENLCCNYDINNSK